MHKELYKQLPEALSAQQYAREFFMAFAGRKSIATEIVVITNDGMTSVQVIKSDTPAAKEMPFSLPYTTRTRQEVIEQNVQLTDAVRRKIHNRYRRQPHGFIPDSLIHISPLGVQRPVPIKQTPGLSIPYIAQINLPHTELRTTELNGIALEWETLSGASELLGEQSSKLTGHKLGIIAAASSEIMQRAIAATSAAAA